MADAISAIIGATIMIGFLAMIAGKLAETPLWIVVIIGIAMMVFAFWRDAIEPLVKRRKG